MYRPKLVVFTISAIILAVAVMFTHSQPIMPGVDGGASSPNNNTSTTPMDMIYIPMPMPFNMSYLNSSQLQSMLNTLGLNNSLSMANITNSTYGESTRVYLHEGVLRPLSFFVGQNLRLLGQGLWSFGHRLKHSGYAISNLEGYLNNASLSLTNYGYDLVNQSITNIEPQSLNQTTATTVLVEPVPAPSAPAN